MTIYRGSAFSKWQGDLFLANLSGLHIRRLKVKDGQVTEQEELMKSSFQRFRQIRNGPDGLLYFSTDGGVIGRLKPKG